MAGLLGKFVAGAASGLAQGIMAQAEAKRQQALLDIERQYRREDARFEQGLRDAGADREALTRSAAAELAHSRSQDEITSTHTDDKGEVVGLTRGGQPKKTGIMSKPDAASADPLEDIWDEKLQKVVKVPRSKAAGLLSASNKPGAPDKPNRESPRDELIRKIMEVGVKGLNAGEREALATLDRTDPLRQAMADIFGGGAPGGSPFADDGMGAPKPGGPNKPPAEEKPQGAVDIPAEQSEILSAPDGSIVEEDSTTPPKRFRKQGKFLIPVQ